MRGELGAVGYPTVPLKQVLSKVETGWSPVCEPGPPAMDEWGVLKLSAVTSGTFVASEAKTFPRQLTPRPAYEVKAGDVLMSRANGVKALVGVACSVPDVRPKLLLPDLVFRLVPDPRVLDSDFLSIALASLGMRGQIDAVMRGTSGQYKVSQADVRKLEIPRVPLREQRRIVAAHAAFERRISALEQISQKRTAALSALVESELRQLVTKTVDLGTVSSSCQSGITLGAERSPRQHPASYLRVANVRKGWIDSGDIAVLEASIRDRPRYELTTGDVLVVEGHASPEQIGRAAVVGDRENGLLYQNHLFRLRFDNVIPEFAMLWLNASAVRRYWKSRCATSSGLYTINSKLLAGVPFPQVDLSEQGRIVRAWQAGRRSNNGMERQIAKLRVLQQGVMADILGGAVPMSVT